VDLYGSNIKHKLKNTLNEKPTSKKGIMAPVFSLKSILISGVSIRFFR
jgi:hypothetical protein